ncbi:(R)-mandelonitrile lyase [Cellulomonas sp. Marseille-Q8402]
MQIDPNPATAKNPPEQFTGDVWVDMVAVPHEDDQRMSVATVRFAPGARTAWHPHARGQYLRVTQGTALVGTRGGQVLRVHPGQTVYTPPGEEHWHGATPECWMEHLAMLESADDATTTTTWLEHVTDAEYRAR